MCSGEGDLRGKRGAGAARGARRGRVALCGRVVAVDVERPRRVTAVPHPAGSERQGVAQFRLSD